MSVAHGFEPAGTLNVAALHKHDHIRPNPANPLVLVKRDRERDAEYEAMSRHVKYDERGLPTKGGKLTDINAPTPTKPSLPMPTRFKKPEIWSDLAARQHPLYRTSSHVHGARPPAQEEMQHVYYGVGHSFTSTFAGGMSRDYSLNTAMNKTRVCGNQEDFGY